MKVKQGNYKNIGKGRLTENKYTVNKSAPTHKGMISFETESLQGLIDNNNRGTIEIPISAWFNVSKFNDEQYIDMNASMFVKEM